MIISIMKNKLSAISLGELRKEVGEVVNRATFTGERTAVTRHGKTVAAIVSVEDLEILNELERQADLAALREAREEDDGTRIPFDVFLKSNEV